MKYTKEDAVRIIREVHGGNIELIGEYINSATKTKFLCNNCGYIWETSFSCVKANHGCPKCAGNARFSVEDIQRMTKEASNDTIQMIGEYKGSEVKTEFLCTVCGHVWETLPCTIIRGSGCPKCSGKYTPTFDEIREEVNRVHNGSISLLGEYTTKHGRALFRCNVCGREWRPIVSSITKGHGCLYCSGSMKHTNEGVNALLTKKHKGRISLIGEYHGNKEKTLFKCNQCGNIWEGIPHNILRGEGCPSCNLSHGETIIFDWLQDNWDKTDWNYQVSFDSLIGDKRKLYFDFYIPSKRICIEFQGEQHYKPVKFSSTCEADDRFERQTRYDEKKREFCRNNNLTLIEITYLQIDDISNILRKLLK